MQQPNITDPDDQCSLSQPQKKKQKIDQITAKGVEEKQPRNKQSPRNFQASYARNFAEWIAAKKRCQQSSG